MNMLVALQSHFFDYEITILIFTSAPGQRLSLVSIGQLSSELIIQQWVSYTYY